MLEKRKEILLMLFITVLHLGIRGTTFKRPGLDAMLDEIRAGNVADRTEDTGNGTSRTETAERPEPLDRAFILHRLLFKTHTPL